PHSIVIKISISLPTGNYPLCRILTNLYEVCPSPLEGHATALVSLLPHAEQVEKNSLFALFELVAMRRPEALRTCVPQLLSYLCPNTAAQDDPGCMCVDILQVIVCVSRRRPSLVAEHTACIQRAARPPHATPRALALVAAALAHPGYTDRERAQEALNFVLEHLPAAEGAQAALLREATALCSAFPALFTERVLTAVRHHSSNRPKTEPSHGEINRTSGGVTIVKLGGPTPTPAPTTSVATSSSVASTASVPAASVPAAGYTRRAKLGDSRSTGRLHPGPNSHRSMTRLNVAGGSVGGLHKSMTRLSSSQQINSQQNVNGPPTTGSKPANASPPRAPRPAARSHHHNILIGSAGSTHISSGTTIISGPPALQQSIAVSARSSDALAPAPALGHVAVVSSHACAAPAIISQGSGGTAAAAAAGPAATAAGSPAAAARRGNNTSVTMINSNRISVFEPYPMRDTVQHFCEKHLDKIKAYMDNVSLRLPPPAKCTIEERRSKKQARLQFACGRRGPHCLFARALFCVRTRAPRVWIHLMFLALQARHASALSSRDPTVASLKHCWDILKCENKTFLTVVTSAFPGLKEQEMVADELRAAGFFDVFSVPGGAPQQPWRCFLCAHPERAQGFVAGAAPVIEGQLQEKKGRWRLFRRWRTRYFTLSAAHLSCKGSSGGESIDINQIRSVKVSRGARNIPKAFEIFTGDQTLILKPKHGKDAEQWVQCLSIAVAHSQARDAPAKANSLPARGLTLKSF
ncbi:protein melted, partial [Ostrinia furnacalis]|uniref:protein melted n=1 Tax=Ostrinia furnacalis TaxID=93504 RepID=UPI00103B00E4